MKRLGIVFADIPRYDNNSELGKNWDIQKLPAFVVVDGSWDNVMYKWEG